MIIYLVITLYVQLLDFILILNNLNGVYETLCQIFICCPCCHLRDYRYFFFLNRKLKNVRRIAKF